ncbi:hypothetical protein FANTH_11824 [Fusarium anthophilum]|uniref:JmjC domain-containing protein n=1 Tax=Fusarium anthophilum TaxID=48485 RepID=A0A8H4YVP8_9HYPO|nr:hypothetical protein FANTH_11824 [Fusarium anthophilum]
MFTQSPPIISASDPLVTKLKDFYSTFTAILCTLRNEIPQPKPQTRSTVAETAEQVALRTTERDMTILQNQLEAIISQAKGAQTQPQNFNLPGVAALLEQSISEATNRPQMDTQASETSSLQPAQTSDDQQSVGSEDVIMTGHNDGGDDAQHTAQPPTTPSPAERARVDLNTIPGSMAFRRSCSAVSESTSSSMAPDASPAGSVATTHITWPESSARACEQDETILDVDIGDGAQTGQSFAGGLNGITDCCSRRYAETDQSPMADARADQPPRSPAANNEANNEANSQMHTADSTASPPPVARDISPLCNEQSHRDDDLGQVMDEAIDMLAAHRDNQHADDQQASARSSREESNAASEGAGSNIRPSTPTIQRSSQPQASEAVDTSTASSVVTHITWPDSSAGTYGQDTTMLGVEGTEDDDQSQQCLGGDLDAASAETAIQRLQSPAANETTNESDSAADIDQMPQGPTTNNKASPPGSHQLSTEDIDGQGSQSTHYPNRAEGDADELCPGPGSTLPTLSPADMKRLISKIQELEAQGCGQHVAVPCVDVGLEDVRKSIDTGEWRCTTMEYKADRKGEGYVPIHAGTPKDQPLLDWPAFSAEFKRPTTDEAKAVFENTVQNPPEGKIPYYIGHVDILSEQALDPGPLITGNSDLEDIHTNYHHIGGHLSGNRIHCEDFTYLDETDEGSVWRGLRSFNEVYVGTGYKLWLVIAKRHIAKFDAFVRKTWQCKECIGGISHQCLLLAPSSLEKEGIDFHIYVVGRGEAVWTLPGQQHSIINVGHCAARSMNFLYPGETIDFKKLVHCSECDQHPISLQHGVGLLPKEPSRKRKLLHPNFPSKKTRNNTAPIRTLDATEERLASIEYRPPQIDRENVSVAENHVYDLVAAVSSTLALQQFTELVTEWRQQHTTVSVDQSQGKLDRTMAQLKSSMGKTRLHKLCLRIAQRKLYQESEKSKQGVQKQHKPGFLDELANRHGMTKAVLKTHLQEGGQWESVCGRDTYDGLLPFIFLDHYNVFAIAKSRWLNLSRNDSKKDAEAFHKLLDTEYIKSICEAGKLFEEMVSGKPIVFLWEDSGGLDFMSDDVELAIKAVA